MRGQGPTAGYATVVADSSPGVLFDVDGTLLDTNYLHVLAWWQAFRDTGHPGITMSALHRAIGIGSEELVMHVLDDPSEDEVQATSEAHSTRFEALREQAVAFPAAGDLLRACADRGLRVVLATSAGKSDLDWMLPAIGAEGAIDASTTADDVSTSKPRPDLLQVAMDQNDLDPDRTVVVGDTVWDVEAATRAGLPCVALLCGGISEGELTEAGARAVFEDPANLLAKLDSSPIGSL